MNYFTVYELKANELIQTEVSSSGTPDYKTEMKIGVDRIIGYVVNEYDEAGELIGEQHYDVSDYNDPQDLIEQIKEDHQPDMWQNYSW